VSARWRLQPDGHVDAWLHQPLLSQCCGHDDAHDSNGSSLSRSCLHGMGVLGRCSTTSSADAAAMMMYLHNCSPPSAALMAAAQNGHGSAVAASQPPSADAAADDAGTAQMVVPLSWRLQPVTQSACGRLTTSRRCSHDDLKAAAGGPPSCFAANGHAEWHAPLLDHPSADAAAMMAVRIDCNLCVHGCCSSLAAGSFCHSPSAPPASRCAARGAAAADAAEPAHMTEVMDAVAGPRIERAVNDKRTTPVTSASACCFNGAAALCRRWHPPCFVRIIREHGTAGARAAPHQRGRAWRLRGGRAARRCVSQNRADISTQCSAGVGGCKVLPNTMELPKSPCCRPFEQKLCSARLIPASPSVAVLVSVLPSC
jgi:hypothetical protein